MSVDDNLIQETASRIFADLADSQDILRGGADWKPRLWKELQEAGLTRAWVPEALGGAEISLAEGFGLFQTAGRAGLAVPFAETLLAGWLLSTAGIDVPDSTLTVVPVRPRDRLKIDSSGRISGRVVGVPFLREANWVAVIAWDTHEPVVALMRSDQLRAVEARNLAGDPSDGAAINQAQTIAVGSAQTDCEARLRNIGAIARCLQIAGSLETTLELCVSYANQRVAFEKPISKFQAVQHNLARLAGEVAAAVSAANSAADAFASGCSGNALLLEVASAKVRCSEAAETGAAIAHQVHGAIGFTSEHVLHRYTLRALSWREDFGNESYWAAKLGELVLNRGPDELWPLIAAQ